MKWYYEVFKIWWSLIIQNFVCHCILPSLRIFWIIQTLIRDMLLQFHEEKVSSIKQSKRYQMKSFFSCQLLCFPKENLKTSIQTLFWSRSLFEVKTKSMYQSASHNNKPDDGVASYAHMWKLCSVRFSMVNQSNHTPTFCTSPINPVKQSLSLHICVPPHLWASSWSHFLEN